MDPMWDVSQRGEWLGFRLCYVIEADMDKVWEALGDRIESQFVPSVRRRTDGFLPPLIKTLHIDINLQKVDDVEMLAILERPYSSYLNAAGQRDYNLGSRHEALFELVDPQAFIELCHQVRKHSEEIVRNDPQFLERTELATQHTQRELLVRNERLRSRNEAI
jgi:ATP-dependent helicase HepA